MSGNPDSRSRKAPHTPHHRLKRRNSRAPGLGTFGSRLDPSVFLEWTTAGPFCPSARYITSFHLQGTCAALTVHEQKYLAGPRKFHFTQSVKVFRPAVSVMIALMKHGPTLSILLATECKTSLASYLNSPHLQLRR
jgi:hypothetical protein